MKSAVVTIFKKELKRFFSDRRMIFSAIILPGLMIFLMYNFMGTALTDMIEGSGISNIAVVNMPESVDSLMAAQSEIVSISKIDSGDIESAKSAIGDTYDAVAVFPKNFDSDVAAYTPEPGKAAPNVAIYYNSADTESSAAFGLITSTLDAYESTMTNKFDVNAQTDAETYDIASEEDMTGTMFSMMLPMLLLIFLYSGCMAVSVESIAGEKERGTIATLLVTPAKRSDIALGKIFALSLFALLSGASSTIGTILSLPKLMGGDITGVDGSLYGIKEYAFLAVVILSTVLVLVTIISIVSAFAKGVREAQTYVLPIMILVIVIGVSGMFGSAKTSLGFYFIPIFNSVQSMIGIFSFNLNFSHIIATVVSNVIATGIGVFILTKLFNNEKVMFSK